MADPVRMPERVVFANAPQVLESLAGAVGGLAAASIDIDISACDTFDSSLIAVLLELKRRTGTAGCAVSGANANIVKLARLYGVDQLLFGSRGEV